MESTDEVRLQILDRAYHPLYQGGVSGFTHQANGANQSCGDEVHWEIKVEAGVLTSLRHQCRACTVCAASADIIAEQLIGKPVEEVNRISTEQVGEWLGLQLSPTRVRCAMLPVMTLKQALEEA